MSSLIGTVYRGTQGGFGNQSAVSAMLNTMGQQVTMDWRVKAVLDGMAYQVRAGTITTPIAGDVAITDTNAEMAADAATNTSIIPVSCWITIEVQGGDALELAAKSVATVSSSGTAFTPLALRSNGSAAVSTARAQTAGQVVVTAELATTTLRHFAYHAEFVQDAGTEAPLSANPVIWEPLMPPVLFGPRCFYLQIASATTACEYMAHFDYVEVASSLIVL